jgi:hypothetical protein
MNPRCRPGDLAVIFQGDRPDLIGTFVDCLAYLGAMAYPGLGIVPDVWRVRVRGPKVISDGGVFVSEGLISDSSLDPIRPGKPVPTIEVVKKKPITAEAAWEKESALLSSGPRPILRLPKQQNRDCCALLRRTSEKSLPPIT